ncbi:LacI family DNA-binding transcriptional regulator [Zhihengliuella alba]|uniref:LacI family DNA-binding transcriptional regulator n=2 Tax=Zhihengliuella alba TaxID=547018 RepID=A0ABP7D0T5_9MICC
MSDVATLAGVSHQTVSRVLNDHPNVRPGTKERVLAAIEELGYRRNRAARALVTSQSSTIGILTVGNANFGPASTVLAVESAARAQGYFVSVSSLEAFDAVAARTALGHLVDQGIDGIVVVAPLVEVARVVEEAGLQVPAVIVAANPDAAATDTLRYVCTDQRRAARDATEHLLGLGHRRIAHVSGEMAWIDALERNAAWRAAMEERGLEATEYAAGGWAAANGYRMGRRIADEIVAGDGPTAIFAANDYIAIGLLRAFWERDLRVPEDVSVVGVDDLQDSAYFIPGLTTIRQPFTAMGQAAMRALLGIAAGQPRSEGRFDAVLEPELIVRDSTAPPPAG